MKPVNFVKGEATMSPDYEGAAWADHHRDLSAGLAYLFHEIAHAFERLNAIEYDAPWERDRCN
jgi:hypothetical protein